MISYDMIGFDLKNVFLTLLLISSSVLWGCSRTDVPNVELIQGMMEDPGYKTQEYDPDSPTLSSSRLPPVGTVPRNFQPYPYKGNPAAAAEKLHNPRPNDFSPALIGRGQKLYSIYCGLCHGDLGKGNGPIAPKMPWPPPSLVVERAKALTDGHLYHIITEGQGVMGGYANQIGAEDRWAVVNYVRSLQKMN